MKLQANARRPRLCTSGMTLVELMMAVAAGSLLLAGMAMLLVSGLFNFAGLGNYASLTGQSRLALDRMSLELREATGVVSCNTNLPVRSLVLTNAVEGTRITYTWDSDADRLTCDKTGDNQKIYLAGCTSWEFSLYQRSPKTNWTFYPTADLSLCKLINMSWRCSRTIVTKRVNTEYVVTSQVVLRNKP